MKKPITIVSTICSLIFLIAIIVFASGIYIDKKNGTVKADSRYETLLNATKENFSTNTYGSPEFSNKFIRSIGDINDFSSLRLEVNGTLVYAYPPSSFSIPSPELVKTYTDSMTIAGKNFTLRASIYLMTPGTIYKHSRLAFLLILIGTLIVGIFIVFTSGAASENYEQPKSKEKSKHNYRAFEEFSKAKQEEAKEEPAEQEEASEQIENEELENQESNTNDVSEDFLKDEKPVFNPEPVIQEEAQTEEFTEPVLKEDSTQSESIDFPEYTPDFTEIDEEQWNIDEFVDSEKKESESTESESPAEEESGLDIIDQLEQENFQSFEEPVPVSPVTNLNLQSSLELKLDELIVSEMHATLALVKINGLDRGNTISAKILEILKDSEKTAKIFEYKADGYALIINKDLQVIVDDFETIYNKITDYLKNNNSINEVSVGISSTSGREVKAERIILEADQALDYAIQDPDSPIVAFRANPEKYKEFIEKQ